MAKELAWKASKVLKPRGFESHALRQKIKNEVSCLVLNFFCVKGMGREPERAAGVKETAWLLFLAGWSEPTERGGEGRQMRPAGADVKSHVQLT